MDSAQCPANGRRHPWRPDRPVPGPPAQEHHHAAMAKPKPTVPTERRTPWTCGPPTPPTSRRRRPGSSRPSNKWTLSWASRDRTDNRCGASRSRHSSDTRMRNHTMAQGKGRQHPRPVRQVMVAVVVGRMHVVVQHPLWPNHPEFSRILLLQEPPAVGQRLLQTFTRRHDALLRHQPGVRE